MTRAPPTDNDAVHDLASRYAALQAALAALDQLIAAEMQRLRARYVLSLDEFRGVFVSDTMVEALLADKGAPPPEQSLGRLTPELIAPVAGIGGALGLCPLGCAVVMLALALEIDARYPTLYAYLNDDVGRRWPTLDLARRLFIQPGDLLSEQRLRALFSPGLPLARGGLVAGGLLAAADEDARPLLLRGWRMSAALAHHLLALPGFALDGLTWLNLGPVVKTAPQPLHPWPILVATGPTVADRVEVARLWSIEIGRPALLYRPTATGAPPREYLAPALLTARLNGTSLVVELSAVAPFSWPAAFDPCTPLALLVDRHQGWAGALAPHLVEERHSVTPDADLRATLWQAALTRHHQPAPMAAIGTVSERFALTAPAIERAAMRVAASGAKPPESGLLAAARAESSADLAGLATLVRSRAGWSDLVLPAGALAQLKDFAAAIAAREQVFGRWGFGAVGRGVGSGLAALFSGGSGAGKTMSAAIIAAELGLDLWRVDLAGTVSKYIGETEKQLERLFSAAGASNAILFFDEADALFGKRSEVKDSHDRYANIEIAYLLQRLEDHHGVVILASNLSRNLDTAFLRRLPFVIEFPQPDEAARAAIWRKSIPPAAPLCPHVDIHDLARRFDLSGGDIRIAALEAAFLAAARGSAIDAEALEIAVRRQLMKRGQLLPGRATVPRTNGNARHSPLQPCL